MKKQIEKKEGRWKRKEERERCDRRMRRAKKGEEDNGGKTIRVEAGRKENGWNRMEGKTRRKVIRN